MSKITAATVFALVRERSGMSLIEAAKEFEVAPDLVRAWETGQVTAPERVMRTLSVLADFAPQPVAANDTSLIVGDREIAPKLATADDARRRKAQLGQFMTPPGVACFMAKLFAEPIPRAVRLLDAGAGAAALTTAFVERWCQHGHGHLTVHAYESDAAILPELRKNLAALTARDVEVELSERDFIAATAMTVRSGAARLYTHAILNPPYRKIGSDSAERAYLRGAGLETVNLYSGFVWLALQMLEHGGELVAIIPRSFCNGPYYEPFRRSLLKDSALMQMHLFDARDQAFKKDKVLQENIIIHVKRGAIQGDVIVSTSRDDSFSDYSDRRFPFDRIVLPNEEARFIHVPTQGDDDLPVLSCSRHLLSEIGIRVSTGPVVDFRLKEHLRHEPETGTVPLLYPGHFVDGSLQWPRSPFKKANAIVRERATEKWLYPSGFYTVVRRFSTKEERRRIVANVVEPDRVPGDMLGFENHLNVFHQGRASLTEDIARGLAVFLNSTATDQWFRRFNGHTQVNATDLRNMRYPNRAQLAELGQWAARAARPSQEEIDDRVGELG